MLKLIWIFVLIFACLALSFCTADEKLANVKVQIDHPQQNAEVTMQEIVRGKVSDPKVQVYVLVHPMLTNLWWVQRIPALPNQDGSWQTLCYFGTETQGIGEYFEVVAILTNNEFEEGQTLTEIPKNVVRSDVIAVKRTH